MPDPGKQVISARTESHSDVAESAPARAHQQAATERQFGVSLLQRIREAGGDLRLSNFTEEWMNQDDGLVHEIRVEVQAVE